MRRKGISDVTPIVRSTSFTTLNLLPGSFSRTKGVSYYEPPNLVWSVREPVRLLANVLKPVEVLGLKASTERFGLEIRATEVLGAF